MLSEEEKDNVFKISVPIFTNEELERLDYTIENDLDNIVHKISETVSKDRDIIILKKIIEKQSKEIEKLKEKNIKAGNLLAKRITLCNKAQCELEDYIENKELINQTLGLEKNVNINKTLEKIIILNNYEDKIKAKIEQIKQNEDIYKDPVNYETVIYILEELLEESNICE